MCDKEEREKLFNLLEQMIAVDRNYSSSESDSDEIPRWTYIFSGFMVAVFLLAACCDYKFLAMMSYAILFSFWFLYLIYLTFVLCGRTLDKARNFHGKMMHDLKIDFERDIDFMEELRSLKKSTLEYALSQFRCQSISLDRRLSIGSIIFSIFIAALIFVLSPAILGVEGKDALLVGFFPLLTVGGFVYFSEKMIGLRKRPDQIIGLLECAIRLPLKAEDDAAPESESRQPAASVPPPE